MLCELRGRDFSFLSESLNSWAVCFGAAARPCFVEWRGGGDELFVKNK